jgi:hypothetical protein
VHRPRLVPTFTLALSICLAFAASAAARPHHSSALSVDAPKAASLPVGVPTKVKVKVANHGKESIAGVVLLARHSKNVKVKPAKAKVGKLKPQGVKAESFTVTVTVAGKAKLEFVAKAPHQPKAHDAVSLNPAGGPKKEEEAKKPPDIIGRYFWNTYQVLSTTYMHAYYFVDEQWVYRGVPKEGLPTCSSQTASGEEDGCLPYTWDEMTGELKIAGTAGEYRVRSHGLKVGEESFSEAALPEAGTKFDASGSYINQFGICPTGCSFITVDLQMSSGGEFARAAGVAGFFGEGGSYGALPPEDHGTYAIEPSGRITFTYADGHVVVNTIAVMLDNDSPDPNYGLLLGESAYFGPDSGV